MFPFEMTTRLCYTVLYSGKTCFLQCTLIMLERIVAAVGFLNLSLRNALLNGLFEVRTRFHIHLYQSREAVVDIEGLASDRRYISVDSHYDLAV